MAESTQHKLSRVRKPRVQITYDVEIGDAILKKELPFVVGILADLAGNPAEPLPRLKDRKFIEIDRDNFSHIMEALKPRLTLDVDNKIDLSKRTISLELLFQSMEDFEPVNIVKQVPAMAALYEVRTKMKDMMTKLDGNDALHQLLEAVLEDPKLIDSLLKEVDAAMSKKSSKT